MIRAFGITQQGAYHKKNDIVCQDANKIINCSDNFVIAAVADGLGSEIYSDIASKIAVEVSTQYCAEQIGPTTLENEILSSIKKSFILAKDMIEERARKDEHPIDQYDTTLSLAVYCNDSLYYGHSGDSGIVALTTQGLYTKVTEQQRDEFNRVYPLAAGESKWIFSRYPEKVASIMLATDGMLETLFPTYLRDKEVSIHVSLARYLMDNYESRFSKRFDETVKQIESFISGISPEQVFDDKTIVIMNNINIKPKKQKKEYYVEPDWEALKKEYEEQWNKKAYPHLFS